MQKRKRITNPNMVANPVILPDTKEYVVSEAKDIKNDSSNVSAGLDSKDKEGYEYG